MPNDAKRTVLRPSSPTPPPPPPPSTPPPSSPPSSPPTLAATPAAIVDGVHVNRLQRHGAGGASRRRRRNDPAALPKGFAQPTVELATTYAALDNAVTVAIRSAFTTTLATCLDPTEFGRATDCADADLISLSPPLRAHRARLATGSLGWAVMTIIVEYCLGTFHRGHHDSRRPPVPPAMRTITVRGILSVEAPPAPPPAPSVLSLRSPIPLRAAARAGRAVTQVPQPLTSSSSSASHSDPESTAAAPVDAPLEILRYLPYSRRFRLSCPPYHPNACLGTLNDTWDSWSPSAPRSPHSSDLSGRFGPGCIGVSGVATHC